MAEQVKLLTMNNGLTIPQIGLGTWKSSPGLVYNAVREALRVGYRHIDCAFIYDNEAEVGQALTDALSENDLQREDVFITSKLWNAAHRPEDVAPAIQKTLDDLQLDYLDLYLMHWPLAFRPGVSFPKTRKDFLTLSEVPLQDTWEAMEALVTAGQARSIGVSNFSVRKLSRLLERAQIPPAMNQVEIHPLLRQQELVEFCHAHDVRVTGYSPLGSLDRPDRIRVADDPTLLEQPDVADIAKRVGCSAAQVLIAWALHRDIVSIPKSTNPDRIRENFDAVQVQLTPEDIDRIDALDRGHRYIHGRFFTGENSPYTVEELWD